MKNNFIRALLFVGCGFLAGHPSVRAAEASVSVPQKALAKSTVMIVDHQGVKHSITAEIARTAKEKEAGLTFRTAVPDNTGMLFLFDPPEVVDMWMRDTPVSLDMIFIGIDGRIQSLVEKTVPFSEVRVTGQGETAAVLEVKAGTMEKMGIVVGDKVSSNALPVAH